MRQIDFSAITPCGESCVGCEKRKTVLAKDVSKPRGTVRNGPNRAVAPFFCVPKNTASPFADCVQVFRARGSPKKPAGIRILRRT